MVDTLFQFFSEDSTFWFCALSGTGLFLMQLLFTVIGGDSSDAEGDGSGEIDASKIKWISKQALAGFLMMFGWVGLTCRKEFGASGLVTLGASVAAGLFAVLVSGLLFKGARKLRSSGTVFRIEDAIGLQATVYQRIPEGGTGKITVSVHQFTHEIDAISHQTEELASFTQVQIIQKADDNTVVVVPIK